MQAKQIVARAEAYAQMEHTGPAEGLLAALIDLFTVEGGSEIAGDDVRAAWERLCRRLDERTRLHEQRLLQEGVELLAANLLEAGDAERAALARDLFPPPAQLTVETPPSPAFAVGMPGYEPEEPFAPPKRPAL
jgi:hypothetical protein